jgi:hypothetical protein
MYRGGVEGHYSHVAQCPTVLIIRSCHSLSGSIRPWDMSSKGRFIQGIIFPRDTSSKDIAYKGTNRPRTNVGGTSVGNTLSRHRHKHA